MQSAVGLRLALFSDTYAPQVNGVARTLARLRKAIEARGGAVRVFTTEDPAQPKTQPDAADAFRFPSVPFWAYNQLRLSWPDAERVRRELLEFTPTIVHAATEFGVGLAGRRAALAENVPFVSSYHTSFTAYARHYRLGALAKPGWAFLRWFHNSGLRTYCPTQSIVDEVTNEGFERTTVWSRGVDADVFSPIYRSEAFRGAIGARPDDIVVLYVGRLAAEKGLDVAVEALRLADRARPGRFLFVAVGDGPFAEELARSAPESSTMLGVQQGRALSEAYASSDVFLFPSVTDTFGNVLLESMASGVPAIGADVGPTREQLAPDRGWLATPGSAAAFAQRLIALADEPSLLARARVAARQHALTRRWDDVWDSLVREFLWLHVSRTHGRLRHLSTHVVRYRAVAGSP